MPQVEHDTIDFVDLEVSKNGSMVKVPMIMDSTGALFWLHFLEDKEVGVLRHNPKLQMGNSNFIQTVFQMRAEHIFFFLFNDGEFFIMDQSHRIKVLRWNEESEEL